MHPSASQILPDLTGEFIDDGSLELLCLLGSGSYGKVYKALDTTSPPDDLAYYAVKCMPQYKPGTRDAKIQESELIVHRMVSGHPRFVFVILELCTGGDFFSAMIDRLCFRGNPTLIKQAFGELLDSVEFCHRNSVYHRDIKPENILCNSAGTDIRLADFGLATQLAVSTQFGCGSRLYMSPESIDRAYANGCYSTRHSDLWALSVIFTNMISGRLPWFSAEITDPGFAAFRVDDNYLFKALEITRPASSLLKRCFHMNPLRRPTLAQFREAVNDIEFFSLEDMPPITLPSPAPCIQLPHFPVATSMTLEWAVAAPAAATGECETPRPTFPIHAPQSLKFTPFVLDPSSSSSSFSSYLDPTPPPVDPAGVRLCSIPSLAVDSEPPTLLPSLPARAYFGRFLPSAVLATSNEPKVYRTLASDARPALPTRRQFLTARRLGLGLGLQKAWKFRKSIDKNTGKVVEN
ncbi:kinase-like domain-containing protein [Mycena leptocephala]|nr:kinase-like domain-containing protein [Mycena leptocephala]